MKNRTELPKIKTLYEYFYYLDGELYWKKTNSNRAKLNSIAGKVRKDGYKKAVLFGIEYYIHRIVYKMFYNEEPYYIDHIDGNPSNNHIYNLQETDNARNIIKGKIRNDNTSGEKNIWINKNYNGTGETRYIVRICRNSKMKHIGVFEDMITAIWCRNLASL